LYFGDLEYFLVFTNLGFDKPPLFLQPEDFWFSAPKKGVMVFALPGEPGLSELGGDFKVHFHDRQGDFYLSVIRLRPQYITLLLAFQT
jgi:hypothetical protein